MSRNLIPSARALGKTGNPASYKLCYEISGLEVCQDRSSEELRRDRVGKDKVGLSRLTGQKQTPIALGQIGGVKDLIRQ